jgi:hypothetical protein
MIKHSRFQGAYSLRVLFLSKAGKDISLLRQQQLLSLRDPIKAFFFLAWYGFCLTACMVLLYKKIVLLSIFLVANDGLARPENEGYCGSQPRVIKT